jgi:hypothetical protein
MAYYDQGGPFEDFTGGEATNSCVLALICYVKARILLNKLFYKRRRNT